MVNETRLTVLSGEEKESCIVWNELDKDVQVCVYSPRWIKHLEVKLGLKPDHVDTGTEGGCRFYTIPKAWLRLPQRPKRLSAAHRAKVVKALAKARSRAQQGVKSVSPDRAKGAKSPTKSREKALVRPSRQSPLRKAPKSSEQGINARAGAARPPTPARTGRS